jgi:acyl-CoA oxidase
MSGHEQPEVDVPALTARHPDPGPVYVGGVGINASKVALAVAIKHDNMRRPFGAPDSDHEELLLDYGLHQGRLLPSRTTCSSKPEEGGQVVLQSSSSGHVNGGHTT